MGQLTDDMHGAIESEHAAMAMIAHGKLAPAHPAPPLLDM